MAEVANFLHTYTRDIVGSDLKQINQILQTLIEICVGNPQNRQVIFDAVIIEPLNRLLELPTLETEKHSQCSRNAESVSAVELLSCFEFSLIAACLLICNQKYSYIRMCSTISAAVQND